MALNHYLVCIMMIVIGSMVQRYYKATGILLIVFGALALVLLIVANILLTVTPQGRAIKGAMTAASIAQGFLQGAPKA